MSAQVYGGSPVPADVVISVPLEALDAALAELRGSGRRITTDSVRGEDVTEEFVAREPHERNLLSVEESPLKLYERAESVNDTLEIEQELTEVWGQIEQVQGRIRYPERRTASSDIILHLEPVATATPEPPWDPYLVAACGTHRCSSRRPRATMATISAVVFCWRLVPALLVGLGGWR